MPFEYEVQAEVFDRYPGYCLGLAVFDEVDNSGRDPALVHLLREAEEAVRAQVSGNVAEHPAVACWREAYRAFGAKPAEHRSSIEALLRRVLKPDSLPTISPLVDIGTLLSLRYLLPAGVHPIREPGARIELRLAREGDTFLSAEGSAPEPVTAGEVVLADAAEVLTRRWTWRQSVTTRTLPSTRRVFFNLDGLPPTSADQVQAGLQELQVLVSRYCGGRLLFSGVLAAASHRVSIELA